MSMPAFFDAAPAIAMRDPLAAFLGAADDGLLAYRYADAVRLAGHSCPTVAGAFLSVRAALCALYPDGPAERGAIRVELRDDRLAGTAGVVANVASFVTGATHDTGFKGIAGRFDRRGLLFFGCPIDGPMRFTRVDDGRAATVTVRVERVPADPQMARLMPRALSGAAAPEEAALFRALWQARVQALLERADDPELIVVQ